MTEMTFYCHTIFFRSLNILKLFIKQAMTDSVVIDY